MTDLPTLTVPDFDDVLAQLERLARTHLLVFRVEVGRTLADAFYGGDVDRYRTRSADGALKDFLAERAGPLADLGLHLPEDVRPRLIYAHVLELARVDDRATRRLLARLMLVAPRPDRPAPSWTLEERCPKDVGLRRVVRAARTLPQFVHRELERYLACGDFGVGFAWLECPHGHPHRLVPTTCKG